MARNTTTASHRAESPDRALLCASVASWRALAGTVVAVMLIAPLLVLGALVLIEAALSSSKSQRVRRSLPEPAPAGWRLSAPHLMNFRPHEASPVLRHA